MSDGNNKDISGGGAGDLGLDGLDFTAQHYKELRALISKFASGQELSEKEVAAATGHDHNLDTLIKHEFNESSGVLFIRTDPETDITTNPVQEIKGGILKRVMPEKLSSFEELKIYKDTGERDRDVIQKLVERTPSLEGFGLDDAVNLASGGDEEIAARKKFSKADPEVLMATAYILLDSSIIELEESYPEFAAKHEGLGTDFKDLASLNILYKTEAEPEYSEWAHGKQAELVKEIANNPVIMNGLREIRAPENIHTSSDIERQYTVRREIADEMAEIYAKVYDLPNFGKEDVHLMHKSLDDYQAGFSTAYASAWSTVPGVKDDEAIFITYNPLNDVMRSKGIEVGDLATAERFLKTTVEELQHTADNIYGDKVLSGELKPGHPAFEHASFGVLNMLNYTNSGRDHEDYLSQHVERTAKITAENVTDALIKSLVQPAEPFKEPEASQSVIEGDLKQVVDPNSSTSGGIKM